MKIFRFVKKVFFQGLTILSNFANGIQLNCISMKNQEKNKNIKLILIVIILYFTILVSK